MYVYRVKGAENVYIGTTVLNRIGAKDKNTAGMYVNTVPVLMHCDTEQSTINNIRNNSTEIMGVFRHQKYQYTDFLKDIREEYGFTDRLYDVTLNYQNANMKNSGFKADWHFCGSQSESLSIHIHDRLNDGELHLDYDYQTEWASENEIKKLHGHLMNLLSDLMLYPDKKPYELKMLSDSEYRQVVYDFNNTATNYSTDKCVHQLFEEQVNKTPNADAIVACDKTLTYSQLNSEANKIANILIEKGIVTDNIVPILLPRKSYLISALLGVLKSGGAYLPIDIESPQERTNYILKDCDAKVAITTREFSAFNNLSCDVLFIEELLTSTDNSQPNVEMLSNNLCYCIYTSGSTGNPKGTLINHENLYNYVQFSISAYDEEKYYVPLLTNIDVDLTVTSIYLPIITGGCSYILDGNIDARLISCNIDTANLIKLTPTHLELMKILNVNIQKFKKIIVGGEKLTSNVFEQLDTFTIIYDEYGPTETTVGSALKKYELNQHHYPDITIGKPIANTQIYILDKHQLPLPIGVAGELCISGDGVGRGYLNRPELTVEKYVPHPFVVGKTMYKTGDLAKWRDDGEIVYIGRIDNQVKIRGLRIELGEIENTINNFEGIKQVAVVERKDENGRQYLCTYYVGDGVNMNELKQELAKKLPRYMVPHFFTRLEHFPTTPSGKTDRKAFVAPNFKKAQTDVEFVAPVTKQEKVIASLLEKVLGVTPIGLLDNFFDLGGDSLKAIEFVAKAHSEGIYFELQEVFDNPTVSELIRRINHKEQKKVIYNVEDFSNINSMLSLNGMDATISPSSVSMGDVLITGATGYLGVHVLDEFLTQESGKAYCLIRGYDLVDSGNRLNKALQYYFNGKYVDCDRIIVINGDITKEILIDEKIDTIIHCAASVKHYGSYQYSHDSNVLGTENAIELAKSKGARLIHISTVSVSGNGFKNPNSNVLPEILFSEESLFINQSLDNVYVRSKFEAEVAVLTAKQQGLNANIIRVGNLTNRYSDIKFQKNYSENATLMRLKAYADLGLIPGTLLTQKLELSPVDYTAKAIIKLVQHFDNQCSIYHVYNPKPIEINSFVQALRATSTDIEITSEEQFYNSIKDLSADPALSYIYEAIINDIDNDGRLNYRNNIIISNKFTSVRLQRIGFEWPEINSDYLVRYVNYFKTMGFFRVGIRFMKNKQYNQALAHMENGEYGSAMEYFKKAMSCGDIDALFALGILYLEGKGVEQNLMQAKRLIFKAKEKEHPVARFYWDIVKDIEEIDLKEE